MNSRHITIFSGDGAEDPDAEDPDAEDPDAEDPDAAIPDAAIPDAEDPDAEDPDGADEAFPMGEKTYFIHATRKGRVFLPCATGDEWNGNLNFGMPVKLPCGCRTYVGEIQEQQEKEWNFEISREENFKFNLCCENHNEEIIASGNAMKCQDILGWAYVIPTK